MSALLAVGICGGIALVFFAAALINAKMRERRAAKRFAMDPVRRLRR